MLNNPIYRQEQYRFSEVEDMVQEQILYEDLDKKYSDTERECIATLNQFF